MSKINGSAEASASKIDAADRGKPSNLARKLEVVAAFIRSKAVNGNFETVKCPSKAEWSTISSRTDRALPAEAALRIYADEALHRAAQRSGSSYEEAYFQRAKQLLSRQAR